jgi:hypothetical protein
MKKLRFLGLPVAALTAVLALSLTYTGCGDADSDDDGGKVNITLSDGTPGDNKVLLTLSKGEWTGTFNSSPFFFTATSVVPDRGFSFDDRDIRLSCSIQSDKKVMEVSFSLASTSMWTSFEGTVTLDENNGLVVLDNYFAPSSPDRDQTCTNATINITAVK